MEYAIDVMLIFQMVEEIQWILIMTCKLHLVIVIFLVNIRIRNDANVIVYLFYIFDLMEYKIHLKVWCL